MGFVYPEDANRDDLDQDGRGYEDDFQLDSLSDFYWTIPDEYGFPEEFYFGDYDNFCD